MLGYSVRYTTSAALLNDLTASLADQTLPQRVRYYGRFDLLVIDEFGFEKIERSASPQAANLLYKIIDLWTFCSAPQRQRLGPVAGGHHLDSRQRSHRQRRRSKRSLPKPTWSLPARGTIRYHRPISIVFRSGFPDRLRSSP